MVALSADGTRIGSGCGYDDKVRVWDVYIWDTQSVECVRAHVQGPHGQCWGNVMGNVPLPLPLSLFDRLRLARRRRRHGRICASAPPSSTCRARLSQRGCLLLGCRAYFSTSRCCASQAVQAAAWLLAGERRPTRRLSLCRGLWPCRCHSDRPR